MYSDAIVAVSLGATPSATNSAAQDDYFYQLPEENRRALATAATEAEAALRAAGESAELVIRVTPQGGVVMAVIDVPRQGITWQTTVNLGLAGAGLGVAAIVNGLRTTNNGAKAIKVVQNAPAGGAGSAGSAASHARHGFTLREINAVGGNKNCSSCAIATDQLLSGNPVSAVNLPNVRSVFPQDLAKTLGREWHGASKGVLGKLLNEPDLRKLVPNPGDRGIVYGYRGPRFEAHYFNVVNQNGTIRFLDGQAGTSQNMSGFQYFMFMGTN